MTTTPPEWDWPIHRPRIDHLHEILSADTGAVIVYGPPAVRGFDIRLTGHDHEWITAFVPRLVRGQPLMTALFAHRLPGQYRLTVRYPGWETEVTVEAGRVSQVDWRARTPAGLSIMNLARLDAP